MAAFSRALRSVAPALLYYGGLLLGGYLVIGGLIAITAAGEAILMMLAGVVVAGARFGVGALTEAANTYLDQRSPL